MVAAGGPTVLSHRRQGDLNHGELQFTLNSRKYRTLFVNFDFGWLTVATGGPTVLSHRRQGDLNHGELHFNPSNAEATFIQSTWMQRFNQI